MRIVLDIDGVLYKFSHAAQYMLAKAAGLADREDLFWDDSRWDYNQPKASWDWVLAPEQANYVYRHGHLWSGAVEFVYDLAKLGDIAIVTKRPPHATKVTMDWLRYTFDHEPFPFQNIHILDPHENKSSVPADVYIDDSLDNMAELWAHTQAKLILVDRPWNQSPMNLVGRGYDKETLQLAVRARSFEEVLGFVRDRAARG